MLLHQHVLLHDTFSIPQKVTSRAPLGMISDCGLSPLFKVGFRHFLWTCVAISHAKTQTICQRVMFPYAHAANLSARARSCRNVNPFADSYGATTAVYLVHATCTTSCFQLIIEDAAHVDESKRSPKKQHYTACLQTLQKSPIAHTSIEIKDQDSLSVKMVLRH